MNIIMCFYNENIENKRGDSTHFRELALNLARNNNVFLITPTEYTESQIDDGLKMYRIKRLFKHYLLRTVFSSIQIFFIAKEIIRKNRIDYIYERFGFFQAGTILSKVYKIRLVAEVNSIGEERKTNNWSKNTLLVNYMKRIVTSSHILICVTEGIKEYIYEKFGRKKNVFVISNGANTDVFRPIHDQNLKKELGLDTESKYVCFVGNFEHWQGVEHLIDASDLILKSVPNTKFLIVGEGRMRQPWEEAVKKKGLQNNYRFTGAVRYEDVPKYINVADVCVALKKPLSSGYSTLKLYEYMACGKPVVATNTKGFEILQEYNAGKLINHQNPIDVANNIVKLLMDDKLREEMGRNGRRVIEEKYSWKCIAEKIEELCKNALNP